MGYSATDVDEDWELDGLWRYSTVVVESWWRPKKRWASGRVKRNLSGEDGGKSARWATIVSCHWRKVLCQVCVSNTSATGTIATRLWSTHALDLEWKLHYYPSKFLSLTFYICTMSLCWFFVSTAHLNLQWNFLIIVIHCLQKSSNNDDFLRFLAIRCAKFGAVLDRWVRVLEVRQLHVMFGWSKLWLVSIFPPLSFTLLRNQRVWHM